MHPYFYVSEYNKVHVKMRDSVEIFNLLLTLLVYRHVAQNMYLNDTFTKWKKKIHIGTLHTGYTWHCLNSTTRLSKDFLSRPRMGSTERTQSSFWYNTKYFNGQTWVVCHEQSKHCHKLLDVVQAIYLTHKEMTLKLGRFNKYWNG